METLFDPAVGSLLIPSLGIFILTTENRNLQYQINSIDFYHGSTGHQY